MKRSTGKTTLLAAVLLALFITTGSSTVQAFMGMGRDAGGAAAASPHGGDPTGQHAAAPQDLKIFGHEGKTDTVVARVNGTEITMARLLNSIMEVMAQSGYQADQLTGEMAAAIRKEAMQRLALEELACQRAARLGITADPAVVQAKLEAVIKSQGGREALEKALADQKKTVNDLKEEISRFLAVKEAIRQEVDSKVAITDREIEQTYQTSKDQFVMPERVVVTDIVFFLDPSDPAAQEKVASIRRQLIDQLDNDPERLTPAGFVVESGLNVSPENRPELYRIGKTMQTGTLSEPLVIDGTLHLLKADLYQPQSQTPAAEAKARVASQLKSERRGQLLTEWRNGLLKGADIVIVSDILKE